MMDPVLAQLAALRGAPANVLKDKWRKLFDTEPPPYNRRFLESRLAYRIQELAFGGLKPETVERLAAGPEGLGGQGPRRPEAEWCAARPRPRARGPQQTGRSQTPVRGLRAQVDRGRSRHGVQQP